MQADELIERANSLATLSAALNRAAELSRAHALASLALVRVQCNGYVSGELQSVVGYEELSRSAHLGAFRIMTYGETARSIGALPIDICDRLLEAGEAMQARALEHQDLYSVDSLSPSAVFYDDLVAAYDLHALHAPVTLGLASADADSDDAQHLVSQLTPKPAR